MKITSDECVLKCLSNFQAWTFWQLQQEISNRTGKFFGEPTISAAIRVLRRPASREKYNLPRYGEIIRKERIPDGKGFTYQFNKNVEHFWSKKDER